MGRRAAKNSFWGENLEERDHLGNLGINGNIILDWIRKKYSGNGWIGLIWLRTHPSGVHKFYKIWGIFRLSEALLC
jgi:hypothetical protein